MSEFVNVSFDDKTIAAFAQRHNIDLSNLPTKEELDRKALENGLKTYHNKVKRWYSGMSVWPADVPLKFSFDKWNVDLQDGDAARRIGNQAFKLAKKMEQEPINVFMLGSKGVGKTSLALAMLDKLSTTRSTMFVSTAELVSLISQRYQFSDISEKLRLIEKAMKEVDVLLLDDFGTEGGMKTDSNQSNQRFKPVHKDMQDLMYRVANSRVDFENNRIKKSTIITSNNLQSELEQMYNDKLISRLIPRNKEQRLAFNGMKDVRGI